MSCVQSLQILHHELNQTYSNYVLETSEYQILKQLTANTSSSNHQHTRAANNGIEFLSKMSHVDPEYLPDKLEMVVNGHALTRVYIVRERAQYIVFVNCPPVYYVYCPLGHFHGILLSLTEVTTILTIIINTWKFSCRNCMGAFSVIFNCLCTFMFLSCI